MFLSWARDAAPRRAIKSNLNICCEVSRSGAHKRGDRQGKGQSGERLKGRAGWTFMVEGKDYDGVVGRTYPIVTISSAAARFAN